MLVIDLAAVTFLDSSVLGALVGALRRLRERGGTLRIVRPANAAARIFELTGLDAVLDLYADREGGAQRSDRVKRSRVPEPSAPRPDLDLVGDGADDREAHPVLAQLVRLPGSTRLAVETRPVVLDDDLEPAVAGRGRDRS